MSTPDLERVYRMGEEYREAGKNYREEDDQFRAWITEPIPEDRSTFPMTTGIKALRSFADNGVGEYATFILISKEGEQTYPDEINLEEGKIRYWGDAKRDHPGEEIDIDAFYGNKRLAPEYEKIRDGRFDKAAPILFFKRERTGYLRFLGLCVLDAVTNDKYLQQFDSGTAWTPNYLYHLSVLDEEEVPLSWIHERTIKGSDANAPDTWTQWKASGITDADIRYTSGSATPDTDRSADRHEELDETSSGRTYTYETTTVSVSASFRRRVFDLYDDKCLLTDIRSSPLVTLSHIVPRSDAIEFAEDITNVFLLNWTHHAAFDSGLFTIDPDLRLWVDPEFVTEDPHMLETLHDRHGTQIELPEGADLSASRIETRNETLDWWPI